MFLFSGNHRKLSDAVADKKKLGADRSMAVARPQSLLTKVTDTPWVMENVMLLGDLPELLEVAKFLHANGAHVEFKLAVTRSQLYQYPLEKYTTIIMASTSEGEKELDVIDIGSTIRRADPSIRLIWASSAVQSPKVVSGEMRDCFDVMLNLPCCEAHIAFAFGLTDR